MPIRVKRVHEPRAPQDGRRVLVDRLWPRGLKKAEAKIDDWSKDLAPSNDLRKWYGHDPEKWPQFKRRYFRELDSNADAVQSLLEIVRGKKVTFLFGSKEERLNNAVALKEYVESKL